MKIGPALMTFVGSADKSFDLDFATTMMTIHTAYSPDGDPSLLQYFTRLCSKNKVEFAPLL